MRIVWLPRARREFDHHIRYIGDRNPNAAVRQDWLVSQAIDRLSIYPNSGKDGRRRFTRELVITHTPFIAVYRTLLDRNEIHILRLLHSYRNGRRNNLLFATRKDFQSAGTPAKVSSATGAHNVLRRQRCPRFSPPVRDGERHHSANAARG